MVHPEDELECLFGRCKLVLVDVAYGGAEVQVRHSIESLRVSLCKHIHWEIVAFYLLACLNNMNKVRSKSETSDNKLNSIDVTT